ncbi:KOW motif-containing protein [Paenibacillus rigui]|uniref:KOW motif-containing protein n=1 Tax=Paenibacillus rigui TaxID=554312 RepID=UPI003CCC23E0
MPQLGQLVRIIRGRDSGKYAVVIGVEDQRFVWIADGDKRKFDQPKKKNLIHLELLEAISSEVVDSLNESGRVTNGKLRYALNKYVDLMKSEALEKGE